MSSFVVNNGSLTSQDYYTLKGRIREGKNLSDLYKVTVSKKTINARKSVTTNKQVETKKTRLPLFTRIKEIEVIA